jgi:flagellar biosynthesis protein FlhF
MQTMTFVADSAAQAVEQIRAQLGPDAVVLNVRRMPAEGLKQLWKKARIEVVAAAPPEPAPVPGKLEELRRELAEIRQQLPKLRTASPAGPQTPADAWMVRPLLENIGLLPRHADAVVEQLRARYQAAPPSSVGEQLRMVRDLLEQVWELRSASQVASPGRMHVFVGAPGVGKTTCLCKWLTRAVLLDNSPARVWRLDGRSANTAEALSVYCDVLGVPVERRIPDKLKPAGEELIFVDFPGVPANDATFLKDFGQQLKEFESPQIHLVLNAAYDTSHLISQARAFSVLSPTDLVATHLDEETCWGKLWNLVLGTNYRLRFLATGQNIPSDFVEAQASTLLSQLFRGE